MSVYQVEALIGDVAVIAEAVSESTLEVELQSVSLVHDAFDQPTVEVVYPSGNIIVSNIHIGTTPPADTNMLWVDTN